MKSQEFSWGGLFVALVLALCLLPSPAQAVPVPTISANAGTNQVLVMPSRPLDVLISLNAGSDTGRNADWWLLADTAFGEFHYELNGSWVAGRKASYSGPLFSFQQFNVLSFAGLPVGTYTIKFGVDMTMNGRLDGTQYLDSVKVSIPSLQCPANTTESLDALSSTQKAFIAARGNPDIFTISFISEEIDRTHNTVAFLPSIRRMESWAYNSGNLKAVFFDNGFFVREEVVGAATNMAVNHLSPGNFTPCMTREDIVALMGEPSCTQTEVLGDSTLSYLRYNPTATKPASTVVLDNGVLASVMAGYSIAPSSVGNNLCASF